ncbi:MAG: transposase [Ignavibacteriaceae bacterium]|nr:transposase [Ignavibacteriaceae bacterium]
MKKIIREKKHRLAEHIYTGLIIVSFTLCIKGRKELFRNLDVFKMFESILKEQLIKYNCEAYIYMFMPDHVHLLLGGKDENSDIKKCLDSFKQKSGFWLYKNFPEYNWQKDYYDHILRNTEDLTLQIKYILNNPVRAGLVGNWKEYKMQGSTVFNIEEWN